MNIVACYSSYLLISIALTVWVARTLYRSGPDLSAGCLSWQ